MNLFDLVKVMFSDPKKYATLSKGDRAKNFFMINRFMAIKLPVTAQAFNRLYLLDPSVIIDLWQQFTSQHAKVPFWIYTKTKKAKADKPWTPDPAVIEAWMRINEVGIREFEDARRLNLEGLKDQMKMIEKQMNLE